VLNKASAALEDANSTLEGVLGGVDYNDQNKLGDAKQRDTTLHKLVQHFAQVDLKNRSLSEPDMLGPTPIADACRAARNRPSARVHHRSGQA